MYGSTDPVRTFLYRAYVPKLSVLLANQRIYCLYVTDSDFSLLYFELYVSAPNFRNQSMESGILPAPIHGSAANRYKLYLSKSSWKLRRASSDVGDHGSNGRWANARHPWHAYVHPTYFGTLPLLRRGYEKAIIEKETRRGIYPSKKL